MKEVILFGSDGVHLVKFTVDLKGPDCLWESGLPIHYLAGIGGIIIKEKEPPEAETKKVDE